MRAGSTVEYAALSRGQPLLTAWRAATDSESFRMMSGNRKPSGRFFAVAVLSAFFAGLVPLGQPASAAGDGVVKEPADYRMTDYRSPVPETVEGGRVVDGAEAEKLWAGEASQPRAVFIDVFPQAPKPPNLPEGTVWRTPKRVSIEGAHWLPNVGYGVLSPLIEAYFRDGMERLTQGDKSRAVVFFCLRNCWMSWNAAKRAAEWGYSNVIWFPDGLDAWEEFDLATVKLEPEAGW